jgi:hypothetical protein
MIKFFRKIRQNLIMENKKSKYFKYSIGEIILVVIGILIALQVNNWNQQRIQQEELNDLIKSVASNIASDIKTIKLFKTARESMIKHMDSTIGYYKQDDLGLPVYKINNLTQNQAYYYGNAFNELRNTVALQPTMSAFEALKNSSYYGKLQETDLGHILSSYYSNIKNLQKVEEEHNQFIKDLSQEWEKKFRGKVAVLFQDPYRFSHNNFQESYSDYENVVNDDLTLHLFFAGAGSEIYMVYFYNDLIALGETFIKMSKNGEMDFSEESKMELRSILDTFSNPEELAVLINGQTTKGFNINYASSAHYGGWNTIEDSYISLNYPDNRLEWGNPYFEVNALFGRVKQMDFSKYTTLMVEMKGAVGGESFEVGVKDKYDLRDGTSTRLEMTLTNQWNLYEFDLSKIKTLDKSMVSVPFAIVFEGSKGMQVHIKTIKFK